MKAMVARTVGGPEVFTLEELPEPRPGPGEVCIEVAYAGLNFAEIMSRRGDSAVKPTPFVWGLEFAGHIRAVGPGVNR